MVNTNPRGTFLCLKYQVPDLLRHEAGAVVITSAAFDYVDRSARINTLIPVRFTAAATDKAIAVVRGLGYPDREFDEFTQANGNRFTGPGQRIGGRRVRAPADWSGVWITQRGDSYWRIYRSRFHDAAGYARATRRDPSPDLIYPGSRQPVERVKPGQRAKPDQQGKPGQRGGRGHESAPHSTQSPDTPVSLRPGAASAW